MNVSERIRNLKKGDCFVKYALSSDLKDAELARRGLLNSVRATTTRVANENGAVYTTTTIKTPVFDDEVLVAIVIKREE